MLKVKRLRGEGIKFTVPPSDKPTEIEFVVDHIGVGGGRVMIGIEAPVEVEIVWVDKPEEEPSYDT